MARDAETIEAEQRGRADLLAELTRWATTDHPQRPSRARVAADIVRHLVEQTAAHAEALEQRAEGERPALRLVERGA